MLVPLFIDSVVSIMKRLDLPEAGIGDGDHAFEILVPHNITSFHGLMIIAQSVREGEIALPIATNDDRRIDDLFHIFSERYEAALFGLKDEIDSIREIQKSAIEPPATVAVDGKIVARLAKLEKRIEESEIFLMRIDAQLKALIDTNKKLKRPKRFFGLF